MKVGELIKILSNMDPELRVVIPFEHCESFQDLKALIIRKYEWSEERSLLLDNGKEGDTLCLAFEN